MKPIFLVGDTHGEWDILFRKLEAFDFKDCHLIHVGDVGIGFISEAKQMRQLELMNNRFKKLGIEFIATKGNHDDPRYFEKNVKFSNLELLPDYTYRDLNGETFLFIGGGVSIDRYQRVPDLTYWYDEEIVFSPERITKPCDVLVTHSGPSWIGPQSKFGIENWCKNDPLLWEDCQRERKCIDDFIKLSKPKYHYCGHFHRSQVNTVDGCTSRILDIYEIFEHRRYDDGQDIRIGI